jgi:diacylglycerol kinase (ATP)
VILGNERNFQIEFCALLINIFLIFIFQLSNIETAIILLTCFSVLALEIVNTAIEKVCDFIHPEFDKRIGLIKDLAAAAVVLMAIVSVVVGILIYWKYISKFIL